MKKYLLVIILLCFVSNITFTQSEDVFYSSVHLTLGVPFDSDPTDDFIIVRGQYALSYNSILNVCNWVSWELNRDYYGNVRRYKGNFLEDPLLPEWYYKVKHTDYSRSGYDRGHMVRSQERTKTTEDNISTFILTNILPQHPDLNQGVWLNLEMYIESLCKKEDKQLFIIAGGIFHKKNRINNIITIPDSCFKIVVILNKGETLEDVTEETPIIAVVMPNSSGVRNHRWEVYRTTINRIESSTGYVFLSRVNKSIGEILKNKIYE